jgi:hypothetical protein
MLIYFQICHWFKTWKFPLGHGCIYPTIKGSLGETTFQNGKTYGAFGILGGMGRRITISIGLDSLLKLTFYETRYR